MKEVYKKAEENTTLIKKIAAKIDKFQSKIGKAEVLLNKINSKNKTNEK